MSELLRCVRATALAAVAAVFLSSCSSMFGGKTDYQKAKEAHALEIPPDLSAASGGQALVIPKIAPEDATYSHYAGAEKSAASQPVEKTTPVAGVLPSGVRVLRDGAIRWLELDGEAGTLWPKVREFFESQGFKITEDDPKLGVMQTSWKEQKAESSDGFFSKLWNKLNSTGLRDSYRARLEPAEQPGKTLLFIVHRGLKEYALNENGTDVVTTAWEWRPSDPELEAEMLQRFLVFMGEGKVQAKAAVAAAGPVASRAVLKQDGQHSSLVVSEVFARTWRRTGLALDRLGVTVEDRDRSNGLFYVRLPADFFKKAGSGFLGGLFSGGQAKQPADRYQLRLADRGETTVIEVLSKDGAADDTPAARHILEQLQTYLK